MRPKYKVTGCARFFVFLVIFVPAVFFGAAYFRGENGVQIIKDFFSGITGGKTGQDEAKAEETYNVEDLKEDLEKAEEEIKTLKEEIEAKDKEIELLKAKAEAKAKE